MNDENLVSLGNRTTSEQREIARKGGIASGIARKAKKSMRAAMAVYQEQHPEANVQAVCAMYEQAFSGDVKAFLALLELNKETVQHDRLKFDQKQAKEAKTGKQSAELPKLMQALKEGADDDIRDTITEADDGV